MRKKIFPLLILVVVPLLALSPLWIHAHAMVFDMADYFLPQRYFLGECLRNGIFPWWNPYSGLGIPFHADPQSGAFYPIAWIIGLVFGYNFYTINIEYLFHLVIAGWGMYLLMYSITRSTMISLCIAVSYQLCGVFIGNAQHLSWVISAAWLPWVIFYWKKIFIGGKKRDAIATALCLMMMTTGGYPAFIIELIYGVIICFIIFGMNKFRNHELQSLKKFFLLNILMTVCYAIITAPYIVSFVKALPNITRGLPFRSDPSYLTAFTPQSSLSFLFPAATLGKNAFFKSDISLINAYIGLLPLIFLITIILTRQSRVVWVLFFISWLLLIISFGNSFLIWNVLFNYFPLINYIHFASSFRLPAMLGFLTTAGIVMNNQESYKKAIHASSILFAVIVVAAILSFLNAHRIILPKNFSVEEMKVFYYQSTVANNIVLQSFIQAPLVMAFIFIFTQRKRISQTRFLSLLLLIAGIDMVVATQFNSRVTVFGTHDVATLNEKLKQQPKDFPISLQKNIGDVSHEGNGWFVPALYNNNLFTKQFAHDSYNPFILINNDSLKHFPGRMDLLNHPVVFISDRLQPYPFDFRDTTFRVEKNAVLVSRNLATKFSERNTDSLPSEIVIQEFSPNEFSFSTKSSRQGVITLLQNYYPGWKATIDGEFTPIQISNYSTMSLGLPEGSHQIVFKYAPGIIRWLLWMSIVSQIAMLIFQFASRKKFNAS